MRAYSVAESRARASRLHYTDGVWIYCPARRSPEKTRPTVSDWCSLHGPVRTARVHDATLGDTIGAGVTECGRCGCSTDPAARTHGNPIICGWCLAVEDQRWATILAQPTTWEVLQTPARLVPDRDGWAVIRAGIAL